MIGYILTPETMLERAIDPTWYFIMVMQNGLFLIFIELAKRYWSKSHGWISQFFGRFGIAGLTPFFIESTVSALIFKVLLAPFNVSLSIPLALLFGFVMAILYGIMLIYWEKKQYKYGIEWAIITCSKRQKESTKMQRMMSHGTLK